MPPVAGGYRTTSPLHVKYASATESQMAFAEKFLKKYPSTRLVTLMIGANDGFICQVQYPDGCISEFSALQKTITANATKIFKGLRVTAHYTGQIALLTYYSTDYSSAIGDAESQGLNSALEKAAKPYDVLVADGYGQFMKAARQGDGNACTAQLLTALTPASSGMCGVHPSYSGAAVLAQAVQRAIKQ
jgi:lysophospholipase L1-like esterase